MPPYIPASHRNFALPEVAAYDLEAVAGRAAVRGFTVDAMQRTESALILSSNVTPVRLAVERSREMVFGDESVTAENYFRRVIERHDHIDGVVTGHPTSSGEMPLEVFWIQIRYVGEPGGAPAFSRKDDGLFAMRTKSGEKAERRVTNTLSGNCSHAFPPELHYCPGFFEIRYAGKKNRLPDRVCLNCGLHFEVKKRNRDWHFRISHSEARPFDTENHPSGWHAFVFPDMSVTFLSNTQILFHLQHGNYTMGRDRYDSWAQLDPQAVKPEAPPLCE